MRAWQVSELGEPIAAMRLADDLRPPRPSRGQLQVRVRAAAVNFPDALMVRGHYQAQPPLPFTPGVELCGEITALGAVSDMWALGDRIIGHPVMPHGAFAEYSLMDAAVAAPAPESLDDASAACVHISYQTAWFALHRRARMREGETVLVHAAAGGVGSAAVQLAKAAGARVIAVVGSPEKVAVARRLGADTVVDRTHEDFIAVVKQQTAGHGADVVIDPVGGEAYTGSTKCIAFEGRIVVIGFTSGQIPAPRLNHALLKNYSILGLHCGLYATVDPVAAQTAHQELAGLARQGIVRPLISQRLPLADAAGAVQQVAEGTTWGRIVISID